MNRDRALLQKAKLAIFRQWLLGQGHVPIETPKGSEHEVLRWRGENGKPMPIIYERHDAPEHYTANAAAVPYVRAWLRERKEQAA